MTVDGMTTRLERAGLELADPWYSAGPLSSREAWRRVTSGETAPRVTLPGDRLAEVDAQWHRLAAESGFFDGDDGLFLVEIEGARAGRGPRHWARVRLTPGWDLAGGLRPTPEGRAEFVAMAVGGDTVLGVTADADGVRITVVDRIAERIEEEARAAAEETPRVREEAWESLLAGASRKFWLLWAESLGGNPAAPDDLRIELLALSGYLPHYRQPVAVVEAAMAHEDWDVRSRFAEYQRNLTSEQYGRLVLAETEPRRRAGLLWNARHQGLSPAAYERLAADPSAAVREQLARARGLPVPVLTALAADSHACVRAAACGPAWPHLDEGAREGLLTDADGSVRTAALLRHHEDHPMPRSVFDAAEGLRDRAVESCRLERALAEELVRDEDPALRRRLARNPRLDPDLVLLLGKDGDGDVRFEASVHPGIGEDDRSRIDFPFDPGTLCHTLGWVTELHDDPDAMRRLAASAHPLLRRSVARARRLPADVVERLARDEDRVVHLFLAESCEDTPAELLLSVWRWWTGSFSHPDRPHSHPNFPRRDLLRYADDPSPRMRRLALDDPDSTPELVERFGRDASEEVRARAAADPRLSAASAVRLLSDPDDTVRATAARHPELPARALVGLLRDLDTAETAALHPALPVPVMRRILEEARAALA
ncbi:PE-PGRS family protein [Streptomyces sp. NPDC005820]|uniref:PE-PGRS family protein n=1 Tax=Streptomyces sp. NPDC005820 TaxID=3157069 RepID=UPI0033CC5D03